MKFKAVADFDTNVEVEGISSDDEDDLNNDIFANVKRQSVFLMKPSEQDVAAENKWAVREPEDQESKLHLQVGLNELPSVKSMLDQEFNKVKDGKFISSITKEQRLKQDKREGRVRAWHEMQSHELTEENKNDLVALQLRRFIDPKRHYKGNDSKGLPTSFQIGTVVEGLGDYKSDRLTRKERKRTFVEEIMADDRLEAYSKRVFRDIQSSKSSGGKNHEKKRKKQMQQYKDQQRRKKHFQSKQGLE